MKVHFFRQYCDEWWLARLGKPTASIISEIVKLDGGRSDRWWHHVYRLADELITQERSRHYETEWTKRGHELEPQGRDYYEFASGNTVTEVGMIISDDGRLSMSPDGLILDANNPGGLEVKSPAGPTHLKYLDTGDIPSAYTAQCYYGLYVSGYEYWDFISHHPKYKPLQRRFTKHDTGYKAYAKVLDMHLPDLIDEINWLVEQHGR